MLAVYDRLDEEIRVEIISQVIPQVRQRPCARRGLAGLAGSRLRQATRVDLFLT